MNNSTEFPGKQDDLLVYPVSYRIVATVVHVIIFISGVSGNVFVIAVINSARRLLPRPTYCYLVSLAIADLITLLLAIPEAIMSHHIGLKWILGQFGCSFLVFGNFLGINAASLSLLAFTAERYIAVLHPFLAQKVCTVQRAKKILLCVWAFAFLYCSPWLGLTYVREDPGNPEIKICDFRLSNDQYLFFFVTDLTLFYFVPLIAAVFAYCRIGAKLDANKQKSLISRRSSFRHRSSTISENSTTIHEGPIRHSSKRSRAHALRTLTALVVVFAICWLPYRGVLVFNTISDEPWLDIWYMLFAKTLIYANSAVNPFLYSLMNSSFQRTISTFLNRNITPREL